MRQAQEADLAAQRKLEALQQRAEAATFDLNVKMAHPLVPAYVALDEEDGGGLAWMETAGFDELADVTLQVVSSK